MSNILPDWRKQAAAAASTNEDIEKAFLDQAYISLNNKATPIMKAPFRIGFEIVHKNDENTRMVGIFVFRVNKELFYAPVFFINGSIKGTDLFYRHTPKKFVPLTNDWVEYLISMCQMPEGTGVPQRERNMGRTAINMMNLVHPPAMAGGFPGMSVKFSSAKEIAGEEYDKIVSHLDESMKAPQKEKSASAQSLLQKFITEDGGYNAINRIANTAKRDFKFASAIMTSFKPEHYMPELEILPVKSASAVEPVLAVHFGVMDNPNVKSASEKDVAKGYKIEDTRNEKLAADVAYVCDDATLDSVTLPGVYRVLLADGSTAEMISAPLQSMGFDSGSPCCSSDIYRFDIQHVLIDTDTKASTIAFKGRPAMGHFEKDIDKEIGSEKPEAGKAYRVYCTTEQTFSEPFFAKSVERNESGTYEVKVSNPWCPDTTTSIFVNPDYADYDVKERVFGKCCRYVEVAFEKEKECIRFKDDIKLGDRFAINEFVFQEGYKQASVQTVRDRFIVRPFAGARWSHEMDKLATTVALMSECGLREDTAEELLKLAADGREMLQFHYKPVEGQVKKALNLRAPTFPEFPELMNDEFNTLQQPNTMYVMRAQRDIPDIPKPRIGDSYSPDPSDMMSTAGPMELYQMSQERGVGSLFEHGVVGELVKTYDSIALNDKYLPDLETALDRLGRMLFLFYWKPEDYAEAYGSDDQAQLENKLISNFKAFGDLVLELMQKAKRHQEGTVSLV